MPLTGLSWTRFKEHLRKTSPIYIVGIAICLILTNLIYTTTRPQVPDDQQVLVYLVSGYSDTEPLNSLAEQMLAYGQSVDETLEEVEFLSIQYSDPETDYTSSYVLMARMSVGDGDLYIACEQAMQYMVGSGLSLPLDEYLADGWMEGLELEPYVYTDEETGESYVAALNISSADALAKVGAFDNTDAYLIVAGNGTNIDTSMQTAEFMIRTLLEGYDVPAESASPEA